MGRLRINWSSGRSAGSESGMTLIETLVALALVGAIVISFLSGLATTSKATMVADEQSTAESLARSQMEWVKMATYVSGVTTYSAATIPSGSDYTGYSVTITAASLNIPDDGIQKITVTAKHSAKNVISLEGYKVNR